MVVLVPLALAVAYAIALRAAGLLSLRLVLGAPAVDEIERTQGPVVAAAWELTVGHGVIGLAWLTCALAWRLRASAVAAFVVAGCAAPAIAFARRRLPSGRSVDLAPREDGLRAERIVLFALAAMALLSLAGAILPTRNDDALRTYMVMARLIAEQGRVTFQASNPPMFGLFPLQVEIHWAALLLLGGGDAAITAFDAIGAAVSLAALAGLAGVMTTDRRARILAPAFLASTPAFATVIGVGKVDAAAAAYGILAFAAIATFGASARAALLGGLCLGWAVASRYTDVVLIPAWLVLLWISRPRAGASLRRFGAAALAGLAIGWLPMIAKNWALGVPAFAPIVSDPGQFWAYTRSWEAGQVNLARLDALLLPLVVTFTERRDMLGTVSPLFLGLLPAVLLLRRDPAVRAAALPGLLGLIALGTSVVLQPRAFHTRHHFVALALVSVPLAVALGRTADALGRRAWALWPPVLGLLALWVALGAWRAMEAVRFAGAGAHAPRQAGMPGFEVGRWLSREVPPGARVSLTAFAGYGAFVRPDILVSSESREELQALWSAGRPTSLAAVGAPDWDRLASRGFRYAVVRTALVARSLASWPAGRGTPPRVVYADPEYSVLELRGQGGGLHMIVTGSTSTATPGQRTSP